MGMLEVNPTQRIEKEQPYRQYVPVAVYEEYCYRWNEAALYFSDKISISDSTAALLVMILED